MVITMLHAVKLFTTMLVAIMTDKSMNRKAGHLAQDRQEVDAATLQIIRPLYAVSLHFNHLAVTEKLANAFSESVKGHSAWKKPIAPATKIT